MKNVELVCRAVSGNYSYVVPESEIKDAVKVLKVAVGPVLQSRGTDKPITHRFEAHEEVPSIKQLVCVA